MLEYSAAAWIKQMLNKINELFVGTKLTALRIHAPIKQNPCGSYTAHSMHSIKIILSEVLTIVVASQVAPAPTMLSMLSTLITMLITRSAFKAC